MGREAAHSFVLEFLSLKERLAKRISHDLE